MPTPPERPNSGEGEFKISMSVELENALWDFMGQQAKEKPPVKGKVAKPKEPKSQAPKGTPAKASPEAVAVVTAARAPDQPLEKVAAVIPDAEAAPKLTDFLAGLVSDMAHGTTDVQAIGRLRNAVTRSTVEFQAGKRILDAWAEKIGRPELTLGVSLGSSGPTPVESIFNEINDDLAGTLFEEPLRQIKFRLMTDTDPTRHDTHRIARMMADLEDLALKGDIASPELRDNLQKAKARLQAVIDESRAAETPTSRGRESREMPIAEEDRDWIYLKDDSGNIIPENDDVISTLAGDVARDRQPLRDVLKELESYGYARNEDTLLYMWQKLKTVAVDPKTDISDRDIAPYVRKITKHLNVIKGLHFTPDAVDMENIKNDWRKRDAMFYGRIGNVLRSRFEQSREVMNLYAEGGVDAFIEAVQEQCGDEIAQRYEHAKQSIYFNHNLELTARNPAGDVEILKKMVYFSHTSYMTEATADPLVQAMIASQEQAIRKILRDNNGFLPSELFAFKAGHIYCDDLAMQYFQAKVEAGGIRDYKRNLDGTPVLTASRVGYELADEVFTKEDLEKQLLRIKATQEQAKGILILTHRGLELFASAKAPGFETKTPGMFSSTPYEGIARFFRPGAHLFGKYHMGGPGHDKIFATIFSDKLPGGLRNLATWSPHDWEAVRKANGEGRLTEWLVGRFGEKQGKEIAAHATTFLQVAEEFQWTGRLGPHSPWGENDATIGWSDRQRELEGGSIRIGREQKYWWSKRYLQNQYGAAWEHRENTPEGQEELRKVRLAYRTWVWAQMTLRSPETVAENVFDTTNGVQVELKAGQKSDLRKKFIRQILGIDTDTQIASEHTPNTAQRAYMDRVAVLDTDVAAIQQIALYGGANGVPREIENGDFSRIVGDKQWVNPATGATETISEADRRLQAKKFIDGVRTEVLGNWQSVGDWTRELGVTFDDKGMLHIANWNNIDDILKRSAAAGGKLSPELLDRVQNIYMGMDDTRLGDMDIANLGERAFARLTNDLEARKTAVGKMMELLQEFKPKMDQKIVLKLLEEMYKAEEAGRGPESASAFLYYFARLFGEYYRGHWFGKMPVLGKLFQRGMEFSVAQIVHGKDIGEVWSINNEQEFVHHVAQIGKLERHEKGHNGQKNKYSIERLEKELIAGPEWAAAEAFVIGYVIALGLTATMAVKQSTEDEEKHH